MKYKCVLCQSAMNPKKRTQGSLAIEIFLWIFFFPAGIIYSIWRLCSRQKVCSECGSPNFVKIKVAA